MSSLPFTLRQLDYFDAVASGGSIAAASERCHVSASALALALDELEDRLAVQLFVRRKGKGVALTAAGTRLLAHARRVLSDAETLAADASQAATSFAGRFGIGCYATLAPFFLPGIMGEFQSGHPQLDLEIVEGAAPELHELLLQGRLDAALLYSVDVSPQLGFEPVREYRPYVMVAEDHRLAGRAAPGVGAVRLAELADEPLILLNVHPSRLNTEHIFSALGLKPRVGHLTSSFELVRCLVARGLGYAVLFQRPASPLTYDGRRLVSLEIDEDAPPAVVGLARSAGSPPTARYDALRRFLGGGPA
ncbi:MAG: LysR substrate-binding domain-containing protein [Caulobacteraceae bacterium]